MKNFFLIPLMLLLATTILLSGCAIEALEGLDAVEMASLAEDRAFIEAGGVEFRSVGGALVVADDEAFFMQLQRIKMEESYFSNPRLYLIENGVKRYVGEAINENSIRLLDVNKTIELPGDMFRVTRNNVNIRTGVGTNYQVFKIVNSDDIVLVLGKEGDWYRIQTGKNSVGYISAAFLIAATSHSSEDERLYKDCNMCNGRGIAHSKIDCSTCLGRGTVECNKCGGPGKYRCMKCGGTGSVLGPSTNWQNVACPDCNGIGFITCTVCLGKGKIMCSICGGKGKTSSLTICSYCKGKGKIHV